jgi:hypothetical protein
MRNRDPESVWHLSSHCSPSDKRGVQASYPVGDSEHASGRHPSRQTSQGTLFPAHVPTTGSSWIQQAINSELATQVRGAPMRRDEDSADEHSRVALARAGVGGGDVPVVPVGTNCHHFDQTKIGGGHSLATGLQREDTDTQQRASNCYPTRKGVGVRAQNTVETYCGQWRPAAVSGAITPLRRHTSQ